MRIHLLAIGTRMPAWVNDGYQEYARRMPAECALQLVEIPAGRRTSPAEVQKAMKQEGERLLAAIPKGSHLVCLDVRGSAWSTPQLSEQLERWLESGQDISLAIGGPEGLPEPVQAAARQRWSLSPLTYPHPLVRIIVAEQLYRALMILRGHPYHRE